MKYEFSYHIFWQLLIVITFLVVYIIFERYKFIKLREDFFKFQRLYNDIPSHPKCAYLYYSNAIKTFIYSPTFLKMFDIQSPPEEIELIARFLPPLAGAQLVNFINQQIEAVKISKNGYIAETLHVKYQNFDIMITPQIIITPNDFDLVFWTREVTELCKKIDDITYELDHLKHKELVNDNLTNNIQLPIWYYNQGQLLCNHEFKQIFDELRLNEISDYEDSSKISCNVNGQRKIYLLKKIIANQYKFGWAIDITELESSLSIIHDHEQSQRDFLKSSSSAIAIYNDNMRIISWNQAFVRLWDLDEKWLESFPSYGEILETLRHKRKLPEQVNFQHFKSEHIEILSTITEAYNDFLYLPNNKILRLIVIPNNKGLMFAYEDITDKLALERSYNTIIDVLKTTLDNLHEGIAVFGENGKLNLFNATFFKIWRLNKSIAEPKPHFNIFNNFLKDALINHTMIEKFNIDIATALEQRKYINDRFIIFNEVYIERTIVPLPDGSILIADTDITDSVTAEKTLRESNLALENVHRMKNNFLANISYELRSPLTNILGYSEILKEYYKINSEQSEYVEYILNSTHYLINLVNQIIDMGTINAGFASLKLKEFSILSSFYSVIENFKNNLGTNNQYEIKITDNTNDITINADEMRIKQLILNLLTNINRNFQSFLEILISQDESNVLITFKNYFKANDYNINELSLILNNKLPLSEIDNYMPISENLGLHICKNLMDLHKGSIILSRSNESFVDVILNIPLNLNNIPELV